MITIDLMIKGRSRRFTARGVTLRASLDGYELYRAYGEANGDYDDKLIARCVEFTRRIFGNAFSEEQLMDGYQGSAFRLFPSLLNAVVGYSNDTIANFPDPAIEPDLTAEATD